MTFKEVLDFSNQNSVAWLATTDGGDPRVRGLWMWFADETGFYFHTGDSKNLYQQLKENPIVEAAFHNPGSGQGDSTMLRVRGNVDFIDDAELKARLYEERPFLAQIREAMGGRDGVVIFRIYSGEARFWNMQTNLNQDVPTITF